MDFAAKIPNQISDIVEHVTTTQPADQHVLSLGTEIKTIPEIDDVGDNRTFRLYEYEIQLGCRSSLENRAKRLASLSNLRLACAPEVVGIIPVGEDEGILISRYASCPGEKLLPVEGNNTLFEEKAITQYRRDMQTLIAQGIFHPYARHDLYLLVGSKSRTLVLADWPAVREYNPGEGVEMLERVEWCLQKHSSSQPLPDWRPQRTRINRIEEVFGLVRPVLPVIHPINRPQALENARIAHQWGAPGVFLIDQGMSQAEVLKLVLEFRRELPYLWVGVNLLGLRPAPSIA